MAKQFKFPDVGEGITEGEIVKWRVKEGDEVEEDQTLADIETDKAVVEVPSPYSGTVLKLHFKEDEIVKVGEPLVTIGEKGEDPEKVTDEEIPQEEGTKAPSVVGEIKESKREIRDILATPKVRKLAIDLKVHIKNIKGTGRDGRITEEDIKKAAAGGKTKPKEKPALKIKSKYDFYGTLERIPLRGVRRATARKMAESVSHAAHVTHCDEADAEKLVQIKEKMKKEAEKKDIKLTYLPFITKALIAALKKHPTLNATLEEDTEEIVVKQYYNIGIAVDVPDGLIVPVIKYAEQKDMFVLAEEIQLLADKAKARTLDLADLKGGTFSITNVGILGGEFATPIINYPEVAILATMKIADRVRVIDGEIKIVKTLPLCLSFDHRVIDGAEAARFMNDLIQLLEDPEQFLKE